MAGTLIIHSNGDGNLTSGHSWIEYQKDGESESHTYGTWGNDPAGNGTNGLFEDLEKGRTSDGSRAVPINDEQEKLLFEKIQTYKDKGNDGWKILNPCSGFAATLWNDVTGEKLKHRKFGISNPSKLKDSIEKANLDDKKDYENEKSDRVSSSGKKVGDPVFPCGSW